MTAPARAAASATRARDPFMTAPEHAVHDVHAMHAKPTDTPADTLADTPADTSADARSRSGTTSPAVGTER